MAWASEQCLFISSMTFLPISWQGIFAKKQFLVFCFKKARENKWSLLLAGNRNTDGSFNNLTSNANFWSSLQSSSTNAFNRNLNSGNATVNRNTNNKTNGFSVRCLKNWHQPFTLYYEYFK
jgi:uncharacterized protein (TIGR02145 family)